MRSTSGPCQLKRQPEGAGGEVIWQKRVPEKRPDWIETARVTFPSGRHADELCVTELAHVVWAANLATLEFGAWPSRRRDTECPDELRIDIDPQPGTGFDEAKRVAAVVHEVLDEIGYVGWPKTSGNRGIHVYCRIEPNWDFKVVRRCALAFAREIERRAPELVTTAWWKEERGEKVFVDYNQNARDRTILSAYSVRGRPDATVSAPVTLGRAARRRDGGLHDRDDAAALRGARRSARGHRRRGVRPARAARVGGARGSGGRGRGAVSAELPEDARRAEARPAVAREEEGGLDEQLFDAEIVGRRGGRTSRHVHCSGSLSSRKRTSFVPWRNRCFSSLSKRTSTTSSCRTASARARPYPSGSARRSARRCSSSSSGSTCAAISACAFAPTAHEPT